MKERENTDNIPAKQTNHTNGTQREDKKHKDDNGGKVEEDGRQVNWWKGQKRVCYNWWVSLGKVKWTDKKWQWRWASKRETVCLRWSRRVKEAEIKVMEKASGVYQSGLGGSAHSVIWLVSTKSRKHFLMITQRSVRTSDPLIPTQHPNKARHFSCLQTIPLITGRFPLWFLSNSLMTAHWCYYRIHYSSIVSDWPQITTVTITPTHTSQYL